MVNVAAILPCRGRPEQTVANVRRLLSTAGVPFQLICVTTEPEIWKSLRTMGEYSPHQVLTYEGRVTYWQGLIYGTKSAGDAQLLVNLANDLKPVQHWLKKAIEGYQEAFGTTPGLLGFNGDSHEVGHSCHFMIHRALLERYGGWPVWYDHNFGDTELCQRAIADKVYAKAPWAILYHDHPYWGGTDDTVYAEGRKAVSRDEKLYLERKRRGWPTISPT